MAPRHWFTGGIVAVLLTFLAFQLAPDASAYITATGDGWANAGTPPGTAAPKNMTALAPSASIGGTTYPVTGIDVSSHDHSSYPIDWASVAASGTKFAYIKATESTDYTNPYFAADYQAARNAGLYVGAYAFGRPDVDPVAQADYFMNNNLWTADNKTLVPFVDVEWPYSALGLPACWNKTTADMVSWIKAFVTRVESRIGRKPMIYTNANWWNPCTGNSTAFGDYPLDIANYDTGSQPTLPAGWSTFALWQYAAGANSQPGNYDKDVFNGDLAALKTLAGPRPPTVVSLRARADGKFVTAPSGGVSALIANKGVIGTAEQFDEVPLSLGTVGLRSHANGRYVSAPNGGASALIANKLSAGSAERFWKVTNTDGTLSLRANINGRYVTADSTGTIPLIANATGIGTGQKFDRVYPPTVISLRAHSNGLYVSAPNSGASALVANSATIGTTQRYDEVRLSRGYVALRSRTNGRYVSAPNLGTSPLIATATAIGTSEMFLAVTNADGSTSLRASINGLYVTAPSATDPLIAGKSVIGTSESFDVIR